MTRNAITFLDCTLRDGGYYNDWDFSKELICEYLLAMAALPVDYVEIGFRSLKNEGFKGGCAFSTDSYLNSLTIPAELKEKIGVMVNGSELVPKSSALMDDQTIQQHQVSVLKKLFNIKKNSPVSLVRIACHVHNFSVCLNVADWLKQQGYKVGFNLMQISDCTEQEITQLAQLASQYPIDVLYFADSMGSLNPSRTKEIIKSIQAGWQGEIGIHAHNNMGQAVVNSIEAIKSGVVWVDSTITGMGRGPGNAQTEYISLAIEDQRQIKSNTVKLFELIRKHFKLMQQQYGWGINPFYYLAGKYGIHPSYIQEMMMDSRYSEEDILAVIDHLKVEGGKKFSINTLEGARHFYSGELRGSWLPETVMKGKNVLIIGTGPSVVKHQTAIEDFIKKNKPYVIALNTQRNIAENLIDIRAACHPMRVMADCQEHLSLPQPLVIPASMLPEDVKSELEMMQLLDFGMGVEDGDFEFNSSSCILPNSLVAAYALAIASSGKAKQILLVGFDGYAAGDSRNNEMIELLKRYVRSKSARPILTLTQSQYQIKSSSIYGEINWLTNNK